MAFTIRAFFPLYLTQPILLNHSLRVDLSAYWTLTYNDGDSTRVTSPYGGLDIQWSVVESACYGQTIGGTLGL